MLLQQLSPYRRHFLCWFAAFLTIAPALDAIGEQSRPEFGNAQQTAVVDPSDSTKRTTDICVYGGTASGIMAAVAASREGCEVIIVEPSRWLGGMTGGGISEVDWGRREAVGGTTRNILEQHYNNAQYREVFENLIEKHGIQVVFEHRLGNVAKDGITIQSLGLDYAPPDSTGCPIAKPITANALTISARVFIDCSYEGDLMAMSGVSYAFGRESREQYDESLAGVEPNLTIYDIDPYRVPGDSTSGLLPLLQDRDIGPLGGADGLTMGYCLRYKFDLEGQGIPIPSPESYDPSQFELFRRGFNSGLDLSRARYMKKIGRMSEKKGYFISLSGTGNTNRSLLTTTIWGCNSDYPDGDWQTRSRIWKFHQEYFSGLVHFLRTNSVVPSHLRTIVEKVSFAKGIFDDTEGWPHQFYVREARRMVSTYVLTQKDVEGKTNPPDSIGLASYGVDEWPYATIAVEGKVAISGGMLSELYLDDKHDGIYKIPLRSITPRKSECDNLLVSVCCSASHIAMTSIRMEPVWMVLGESAGVAASIASKSDVPVQDVPYDLLRAKLLQLSQRLERPAIVRGQHD